MGHVVSVNVGQPRQISVRRGRPLMSSIVKEPVVPFATAAACAI